jgi:Fe-S-cluster containining protein
MNSDVLKIYEIELKKLTEEIESYFENQQEYMFCKEGCSICCQNSYYPCSELEYDYLKTFIDDLDEQKREIIQKKAVEILKQRKEFLKTEADIMQFSYECPFLVDDSCIVYSHRPLICRGHGLLYHEFNEPNKHYLPYCTKLGLNYSNVYNPDNKKFDLEKIALYKNPPQIFNTTCSALMKRFENIQFGDTRMLYEFIIIDIPDYREVLKEYF